MKLKWKMTKTGKEWKEFVRNVDILDDDTTYRMTITCRSVRDFIGTYFGTSKKRDSQLKTE